MPEDVALAPAPLGAPLEELRRPTATAGPVRCGRAARRRCSVRARIARIVLVGEQPGDREDLAGKAFVGPAGRMLGRALMEADIPAGEVYATNAV